MGDLVNARPGVMFYFDIRPCLRRLSIEEKGLLFEAILSYGECGELPEFDGGLGIAWDFIKPGIDRDSVRYQEIREKRSEAGKLGGINSGKARNKNTANEANGLNVKQTKPTTAPTPISTTTSTSATVAGAEDRGGVGEKGTASPENNRNNQNAKKQAEQADDTAPAVSGENNISFEDMRRQKIQSVLNYKN